jgi:flavin reductase (DIM6/NTAB) family NADH-FMN oxidoreductase RutF
MNYFNEIKPEEIRKNTFELIGRDWMLVTAKKDNKVNTMTASWGGLGILWNKPVSYVFIRPQRFTKEFVDDSDTFSLSFLASKYKKELSYLGSVSGRDEDKISKSNLTLEYSDNTPYFGESNLIIVCKKLYSQDFKPECFIENEIDEKNYSNKDYHTMYISEIKKVLIKETWID